MASRVVSQKQIGDVVPIEEDNRKKNDAVVDGRNRQALGDIGNQITRPRTRGFCAQLLAANAQIEDNNKIVNLDGVKRVPKPVKKKVVVKPPKPEDVIVISPDTTQPTVNPKPKKDSCSKKKGRTFTSLLTARSKYACGISNKPKKEDITNIDAADKENEFAVVQYVEDMYHFYKMVENESQPKDYMKSQPEINEPMREVLVDWLIEVHRKFDLTNETLFLTVNIIDRFLSSKIMSRKQLQLVGISAMLTASKYEETSAPEVNDFVCISDRAYTQEQILSMEKIILGELKWELTVPTLYVFLVRFIKASLPYDKEMENLVYYIAELGIMSYSTTVMNCPSMVAASAVYTARYTLNKTPFWNATLELHTGFSEAQLNKCVEQLVRLHGAAWSSKLQAVRRKYSNSERLCVALLPEAMTNLKI